MPPGTGIHAWGTYLPRFRMQRSTIAAQVGWLNPALGALAKGRRCVANWDEDALTLAVAAGRNALASCPAREHAALVFASTTAPFADRSNAGLIAEALSLPDTLRCQDTGGSQRAASAAMLAALETPESAATLLVAADRRVARAGSPAEMRYGDAAAAVALGAGDGLARYLGGASRNVDLVHQYRTRERDTDYVLEDRWVRDAGILATIPAGIEQLAERCGVALERIAHLSLPVPARHGRKVCARLGVSADVLGDDFSATIGDTGAGHLLLQLAHALESAAPGEIICVAGFGQGCDVAFFETTAAIAQYRPAQTLAAALQDGIELTDYLRLPAYARQIPLERGIRGEADKRTSMSVLHRRHADINAMRGSQCDACGTPHFPRARICVSCGAVDEMRDYGFAARGARLKTYTEDWLAATPAPPLCYGNVAFEGGGNAFLELTDVQAGTLRVGMALAMQFRIKDFDELRGFRRYFWKPAPCRGGGDG